MVIRIARLSVIFPDHTYLTPVRLTNTTGPIPTMGEAIMQRGKGYIVSSIVWNDSLTEVTIYTRDPEQRSPDEVPPKPDPVEPKPDPQPEKGKGPKEK